MQKLLTGFLAFAFLGFLSTSGVSAHEGIIDLSGSGISCKGISLFQDGNYRVFGRCDGLPYPYETLYNKYVLWGKTSARGDMVRVAEVDRGYFSGNIASAFDTMTITAEKDSLVHRPSDKKVVTGSVSVFNFDKSQAVVAPSSAPAATTNKTVTVQNTTSSVTSTAGAIVGKIVTSLLVIILVVVGLVIGASLIFRSRGSVSA